MRRQVLTLAEKLGVTVHAQNGEVNLEAPRGWCFSADCHERVHSPWDAESPADVWRHAHKTLENATLARCDAEHCPSWDADGPGTGCPWWAESEVAQ